MSTNLEEVAVTVMVMYKNGAIDTVEPSLVEELISSNRIEKLLRQEGWATVGIDPLRGWGGSYEGPERRTASRNIAGRRSLAESPKYLDKIINSIADPIFVKDRQHCWVFFNDAFCSFMGRQKDELLGKSDYDVFSRDEADVFWSHDEKTVIDGQESVNEEKVADAGGVIHIFVTKRSLFTDEKGEKFIVGIMRDITARKRAEEERRGLQQEVLNLQKLESVGLLAGGIAHDFNNLLMAILGNISLARISPRDEIDERLDEAEKAVFKAKDLTQRLLTFSKGGAPVRKTVPTSELIRNSVRLSCTGRKAICEVAIPDDIWPISADEGQISQAINNIIINADQSMPYGGKILISCENIQINEGDSLPLKSGRYVSITIRDQGVGIPEENLRKIYDPYFTTKETGRGLGLAATYSIIKNHRGHITVASSVRAGTAFTIYLPASEFQDTAGNTAGKQETSGKGKILIMDDEESIRKVSGEILKQMGYEVQSVKDGSEAIKVYSSALESGKPFDVVIMDLTILGGMGGKEAIRKLLEIDPGIRAIVSSGYSGDPVMSNFKDYGFSGVMEKPFKIGELSEQIRKLIKKAEG